MHIIAMYIAAIIILSLILILLWKEEKRFRKSITHGLANKFWVLKERRRFVRFEQEVKIRYNLLRKQPNLRHSKTANISKKGLCILTYEKLKEKTYLDLEVDLPGFSKPVKVIGEVRWLKDLQSQDAQGRRLFYVGIRFSKIDAGSEAMLLTHLNTLRRA